MKKRILSALMLMMTAIGMMFMSGCGKAEKEAELVPVDFTVVSFDDLPKELAAEIESKKSEDFRITYSADG